VCAGFGTDSYGFGGVRLCCVWESLCGFGGLSVCCVNESSLWVWRSVCVLYVGQFGVCLGV